MENLTKPENLQIKDFAHGAEAEEKTSETVVQKIFDELPVP